ncbi:MAG: Small heat shock protein HSP16.5 [Methanocella sp. PtaU1.Bin125]|nr:MAG: Small heat shock protein HSP16.5 [Methanocella sp. PtaU1.Bin125]
MASRKRRDPFDIFRDFDEMFNEMFREMESGRFPQGGPFFYGFSWNQRPGEEPEVREFGNIRPGRDNIQIGERKPLVDVFDTDETVQVIAEMPGIEKSDVELGVEGRSLEIRAARGDRRYHETVELPADVDQDSAKATYKNGVLEVTLKKTRRQNRKKINVE